MKKKWAIFLAPLWVFPSVQRALGWWGKWVVSKEKQPCVWTGDHTRGPWGETGFCFLRRANLRSQLFMVVFGWKFPPVSWSPQLNYGLCQNKDRWGTACWWQWNLLKDKRRAVKSSSPSLSGASLSIAKPAELESDSVKAAGELPCSMLMCLAFQQLGYTL